MKSLYSSMILHFSNNPHLLPFSRLILMASMSSSSAKKLIKIDIVSDTICPWCYVGKKNLDKAVASSSDQYDFEIKWRPYLIHPNHPKEGIPKKEYHYKLYGARFPSMEARINGVFNSLGLDNYDMKGLIGNTLDSHRLIYFAGTQGQDKQHQLVEELSYGYFIQGKYIGDRSVAYINRDVLLSLGLGNVSSYNSITSNKIHVEDVNGGLFMTREYLLESAKKAGVEGAEEFLQDPNNGLKEINEDVRRYSSQIHGVPHFIINGEQEISGGQPPETFLEVFREAA